jgi:two-component system cell cycle sensor histidine kinase/response regulator CckA
MVEKLSYEALQQRVKELEESKKDLAFRNKQLASLIDNSQLGIVTLDKDMRIVECNEAFERLFQYALDEMEGAPLDDLIVGPDQSEEAVSYTARTLTGKPIQGAAPRRRKDKTFIEVKFSGIPLTVDGEVVGAYGVYEDITPLKKAEEALKETEQAFRALLNAATDTALLLDDAYRILALNDIAATRIGYVPEDLVGRCLPDLFSPEVAEIRRANLEKARKTGKPVRFFEKRDNMYYDTHFFPIIGANGKVTRIAIFGRDITAQQEAEKALKESEEKYRTILESIEEGYYETDLDGNFTFFNESLCRIFGVPGSTLNGMNYRENTGEEFAKRLYRVFHEVYATGRPDKGAEYEILRNDGTSLYVEVSASLLRDGEGSPLGFRGIIRDIMERKHAEQERKRLEAQFHQAQRMEAIGTLAGGIAHDFNNLLMAMQGNASLMLLDKDPDHPDYDRLKNIEQYIRDAADLTKQLLGFARGGQYEVKPTNLNDLMNKSATMLGRTKKEILIHTKYQEDLWMVAVDEGQIQQVLINLFINAWQAMPGGGDLYLETENVALALNDVKAFEAFPGRYVKMTVMDTGVGMDEKTLSRVFQPFFTTKGMGRGSGLGLASAYGIVKNHGGMIKAYSEVGTGSTFVVYLPANDPESGTLSEEQQDRDEILRGTETVLLVDDEDTIIDVGGQLLKELGYTVVLAGNGKAAVEMVNNAHMEKAEEREGDERYAPGATPHAPDLVILDMVMPDMGGGETFDQLKAIDPDIKVLLSSGYSIDGQAREILRRGCDGFIQKPFNIRDLSRKIREILDKG